VKKTRIGRVQYLNCLPVYHAIEEGILPFEGELVSGVPTALNALLLNGELEITPISSIAYARHQEKCLVLPDLSIAADGPVKSILLLSDRPVEGLDGKKIYVTKSSATAVAMLQILLKHYYRVKAELVPLPSDSAEPPVKDGGVLLIGDRAMEAHLQVLARNLPVCVTDLGEIWKKFTGKEMIYALWVVRRNFALAHRQKTARLARLLLLSKETGLADIRRIVPKAQKMTGFPAAVIEEYFRLMRYDFGPESRASLLVFYDWARQSGLLDGKVELNVWGEGENL
jgi:chorismate dehydratase